jgi:hypothetical protein
MPGKTLSLTWRTPPDTTGSAVIVMNLAKQWSREEMVRAGERQASTPCLRWSNEWPELVYVPVDEATPGGFLTRLLCENHCALVIDQPSVPALQEALTRLRNDESLWSHRVRNAGKTAERFRGRQVAAALRKWPAGSKRSGDDGRGKG